MLKLMFVCLGGLVYSHDLQTCDWPRNVACKNSNNINNAADPSSPGINDINTDTINDGLGIVLESKKVTRVTTSRDVRICFDLDSKRFGEEIPYWVQEMIMKPLIW